MSSRSIAGLVRKVGGTLGAGAPEVGDAQLLERVRSRPMDGAALEAIIRRHGPMVLGVCRRVLRGHADADDAFQATFLVFLRRAGSLHRPECLAGWLFQVAYRTARKAMARAARRHMRERPLVDVPAPEPVAELVWRDLWPIFDEELNRLPERYRLPIVLCFLEGRTKRQGARALGWPEGTFASRLQRGRELLRDRLTRRGLALSAGVFAVALFQGGAGAAVPDSLLTSTIQTAVAWAMPAAAPAVALAKGVIQSMFLTKMKVAALTLVAATALGGGGSWAVRTWAEGDAVAADGPGQGSTVGNNGAASAKPTAAANSPSRKVPYVNRLFAMPADGSVTAAEPSVPKANTIASGDGSIAREAAEEKLAAEIAQAEAALKAAEAQLERARANRDQLLRGKKVDDEKRHRLGLSNSVGATPVTPEVMKQQIDFLRKQLAESEAWLAQYQGSQMKQPGGKAEEVPGEGGLNDRIRLAEERLQLSRRMAEKGYLKPAQVQAEAEELDRLKARLEANKEKAALRDAEVDGRVRRKAADYDRIAALVKQGAASRGELIRARAELAEARILQANETIREELKTLLDLTKEHHLRATKLYESGALPKQELEKTRQAIEEAEKRLRLGR